MNIGIPKESLAGETRVACTPATVAQLQKLGFAVVVERGAGQGASLADAAYEAAGATLADTATVWQCPLLYKVNAPNAAEIARLTAGQTLVSFLWPAQNPELVKELAAKKVNVLAMDMVPRISRAQALDALSSMANISGYRAVIEAANAFGRFFTGQITAAGKVPPAQVLIIAPVLPDWPPSARRTRSVPSSRPLTPASKSLNRLNPWAANSSNSISRRKRAAARRCFSCACSTAAFQVIPARESGTT